MKRQVDYSQKPYNRCLSCQHREGGRCDGPRTSAMELPRWCEYMRDMKEINGLTNAFIADKSGVSLKTIEKIMSLKCEQDIMRETARLIENAVIGSSNQYPCYLAYEEQNPNTEQKLNDAMRELERALADNKDYRDALDSIHASYNAEMATIRGEAQRKTEYLIGEVQRARAESDFWRAENDRKGKLIDKYLDKMIGQ